MPHATRYQNAIISIFSSLNQWLTQPVCILNISTLWGSVDLINMINSVEMQQEFTLTELTLESNDSSWNQCTRANEKLESHGPHLNKHLHLHIWNGNSAFWSWIHSQYSNLWVAALFQMFYQILVHFLCLTLCNKLLLVDLMNSVWHSIFWLCK
jgi:hypothetical protein